MDKFFTFRLPKRWVKIGLVMAVIATLAAPGIGIASHTFIDVPDTNTHHDNITWLANAGVTEGCNPPANDMYCPSDPVTRAQMATFMRRLAENRVVDADTLDGHDSTEIGAVALQRFDYFDPVSTSSQTADSLASFTVTAPGPGVLLVRLDGQVWHDMDSTSTSERTTWFELGLCDSADSDADCDGTWRDHYTKDADNSGTLNATYGVSKVRMVNVAAAGDYTFYINAAVSVTSDTIWLWDMYATALFVPGMLPSSRATLGSGGLDLPLNGQ